MTPLSTWSGLCLPLPPRVPRPRHMPTPAVRISETKSGSTPPSSASSVLWPGAAFTYAKDRSSATYSAGVIRRGSPMRNIRPSKIVSEDTSARRSANYFMRCYVAGLITSGGTFCTRPDAARSTPLRLDRPQSCSTAPVLVQNDRCDFAALQLALCGRDAGVCTNVDDWSNGPRLPKRASPWVGT